MEDKSPIKSFCRAYKKKVISYYESCSLSCPDVSHDGLNHSFLRDFIRGDDVVLEIGCGTGTYTLDIAGYCKQLDAIDPVKKFTRVVKSKIKREGIRNVNVYNMDIDSMKAFRKNYDVVFFGRTLSQLPNPKEALYIAKEKLFDDGRILVLETEIYPDPCGSFYPSFLKKAEEVCEELKLDLFEVMKETLIPFVIDIPWVEELAEATGMVISRSKRLTSSSRFKNFILELKKG